MYTIGIVLEKDLLKAAVLKREKKNVSIASLQNISLGPDNVKQFYNLPPFHEGKEVRIASGLPSVDVFLRKLHLPLKERRKILSALPFQIESLIPFPAEEAIICPLFNPVSQKMTSVTLIATEKKRLSEHLDALNQSFEVEPDVVSCTPSAQKRFASWQFPNEPKVLCFNISNARIACPLYEHGEILLSQSFLIEKKEELAVELEKFSTFLKQKGAAEEEIPWLLTGDLKHADVFRSIFRGKELTPADPTLAPFALAIGYALDAMAGDAFTVQFCRKAYTPEKTLRWRKKKVAIYLAACAAAALLMAVSGSLMLGKKQRLLTEKMQSALPSEITKGTLSTYEQVASGLWEWERSLSKRHAAFAFAPTMPKVSDVLAWLSAHPALSNEDGSSKEGIEIRSVHYTLTKYPKIGDAASPYLAHVDLELNAAVPRIARDFHDALLKGDHIVNARKDIKWQMSGQSVMTSFELNKAVAP